MKNVYEEIYRNASPVVENYRNDLIVIDKEHIDKNFGIPFLHMAREYGTHLLMFEKAENYPAYGEYIPYLFGRANREEILAGKLTYFNALTQQNYVLLFQFFDGKTVKIVDEKTARKALTDYTEAIKREWYTPKTYQPNYEKMVQ